MGKNEQGLRDSLLQHSSLLLLFFSSILTKDFQKLSLLTQKRTVVLFNSAKPTWKDDDAIWNGGFCLRNTWWVQFFSAFHRQTITQSHSVIRHNVRPICSWREEGLWFFFSSCPRAAFGFGWEQEGMSQRWTRASLVVCHWFGISPKRTSFCKVPRHKAAPWSRPHSPRRGWCRWVTLSKAAFVCRNQIRLKCSRNFWERCALSQRLRFATGHHQKYLYLSSQARVMTGLEHWWSAVKTHSVASWNS